jgi:AbrB family looped-hinge helix DNA binding protein
MPEIRVRPKGQVTLPASILREAKIEPNDELEVSYLNGAIVLRRVAPVGRSSVDDVMSFAGLGRGLWGDTTEEVTETIQALRNEWER